jgi:hypothetical protein
MFNFPGYKRNANQNTLGFHLTPVRMAIFKSINNKMLAKMQRDRNPYYVVGGNVN